MKIKSLILLTVIFSTQSALSDNHINTKGNNLDPFSFGDDQTIVDINKIIWSPLKVKGLPKGAEIAVLRGSLEIGESESMLRLPPDYVVPQHNHTSDELYIWIKGAFSLITHNGSTTKFDAPTYISFPGNAPTHGLKCGSKEPCILYLKYSRPFDIKYPLKNSKKQ